jgi:hypothetical protein
MINRLLDFLGVLYNFEINCSITLNSEKNVLFKNVKFDQSSHLKKIKLTLYLKNK